MSFGRRVEMSHLGYFDNEVEAAEAVDIALIKYLGIYEAEPNLNFDRKKYSTIFLLGLKVSDVFSFT
jgi:hypothetical protein